MIQRKYLVTQVEDQYPVSQRALQASVAHALPHLKWRHHGIGALQAYLIESDPEVRVHIWHPELLRGQLVGSVHDHRFTLHSAILIGSLWHTEYHVTPSDTGEWRKYTVVNARKEIDAGTAYTKNASVPEAMDGPSYNVETIAHLLNAGSQYIFPAGEFHSSHTEGLTVTIVTKLDQVERRAILLGHRTHDLKHGFAHETFPENKIVDIVREARSVLLW